MLFMESSLFVPGLRAMPAAMTAVAPAMQGFSFFLIARHTADHKRDSRN